MQAFGMMGWRLGYIAYPDAELAADPEVGFQMSKVQDTIPICVTQMSQVAGLGALQAGSPWVRQQVQGLSSNRLDWLSLTLCNMYLLRHTVMAVSAHINCRAILLDLWYSTVL